MGVSVDAPFLCVGFEDFGMARVNESDLARKFQAVLESEFGIEVSLKGADKIQDAYQELIAAELEAGNDVYCHHFGSFKLKDVPERKGTSFGRSWVSPAHFRVSFSAASKLDEAVNAPINTPVEADAGESADESTGSDTAAE